MGIGNRAGATASARRHTAHYPSWGLETRGSPFFRCVVQILITPHGDWKQRGDVRETDLMPCLITPHGDWKPSSARRYAARPGAHYPSWGLETRLTSACAMLVSTSLPLMGIGNPPASWDADTTDEDSLPLMGIGNSTPASTSPGPCRTHYPSWGLETCRWSPILTIRGRSLPLMGIGNSFRPSAYRNMPCSLPLMGIGNAVDRPRVDGRPRLITPHGDWKPCRRWRRSP